MPSAFDRHRRIGEILGRMVIEYGEMEWDLCLLVGHIIEKPDVALKAMYRSRGESQRISVADALARNCLPLGRMRTIYEECIANMRVCLKFRNQYAHTNWIDNATHGLCFINIEELAQMDEVAGPEDQQLYKLDLATVEDQQRFFVQTMQNMRYLIMEIQSERSGVKGGELHYVKNIARPLQAQRIA